MDAPFFMLQKEGAQGMTEVLIVKRLQRKIWEFYRNLLGKQWKNGNKSVQYDDIMSDNEEVQKIVHMRNILTGK